MLRNVNKIIKVVKTKIAKFIYLSVFDLTDRAVLFNINFFFLI